MNPHFQSFINLGKQLAAQRGLTWDIPVNEDGSVSDRQGWTLNEVLGEPPPNCYLRDFGYDSKTAELVNKKNAERGLPARPDRALSQAWQDLLKAAVLDQLLVRRNTLAHISVNIIRPIRVIATCAGDKDPWALLVDDIIMAVSLAREIQASGKLGDLVFAIVKNVMDPLHILDAGPLYPALSNQRAKFNPESRRPKFLRAEAELRKSLNDRKNGAKLPEARAFWELIRIVMTEQPTSFMDELRFAAIRLMVATGFRIGEATMLPLDWRREREYFTQDGRPAGSVGGYSKALMIRYFAEKQQEDNQDSRILVEEYQYVSEIFVPIIEASLARVEELTRPLRKTLKMQTEIGRLLPQYQSNELVPLVKMYTALTGNPIWMKMEEDQITKWTEKCKGDLTGKSFDILNDLQIGRYFLDSGTLDNTPYVFLKRLRDEIRAEGSPLQFRWANGALIGPDERIKWAQVFVNIGELEQHIAKNRPSKVSDLQPLNVADGEIQTHELLFIHPKRSLVEERNEGVLDVTRYMAIGRPDSRLVGLALGDQDKRESIFSRYGKTAEDRQLFLTSHMLRHLQNTELFRLGIHDAIITKRFGRRSVAQSYEYDHRSLAEELDQIEIPVEVEMQLGEKATTVAKMIKSGRASGPIVEAFKRIQASEGDTAAFDFLKVEADGFHATPYGHCLNSFTVDPCPKHLECFAGCRHLSATNLPEHRTNLVRLEKKLSDALEAASARKSSSVGLANQIEHAKVRLEGVRRLLTTETGEQPFPDGPGFSTPTQRGLLDD